MPSQDIRNNAFVHSILVRNYINTQKVDHSVVDKAVTIIGSIELQREATLKDRKIAEAAVARTLEKVEKEIKRIPNIEFVKFHLDNWARQGRRWVCTAVGLAPRMAKKPEVGEEKRVKL